MILEFLSPLADPCFLLLFLPVVGFVWAPKTWTPGELVSASSMNTNIRDHLNESLRTQTTALTGSQDDFDIDGPFSCVKCTNATQLVITGALLDSGNLDGARVIIEALSADVVLTHQDASSATANRIVTPNGDDITLEAYDRVLLIYDGTTTKWLADIPAGQMNDHRVNLLADPGFLIWPAGDAADPAHWVSSGAGVAIARETGTRKFGEMCAKLTYGSAAGYLDQDILPSGDYDDGLDGDVFSFGAWIWTDSSDMKIGLDDGADSGYSLAHAGDSAWEWLTGTHILDGSATKIAFRHKLNAAGDMFSSWPTVVAGPVPPRPNRKCWPRAIRGSLAPALAGDPVETGTELWAISLGRPFIVEDVQIECVSDAGGQAMILDINHWNGAAWVSMFTTKPEVAVGERSGGEQPDGTYRYRCFGAGFGTAMTDSRIGIDCDQAANSGAKNPTVSIRALQFQRPQEVLLGHESVQ